MRNALLGVIAGFVLTVAVAIVAVVTNPPSNEVTQVYATASPCGVFTIVVIRADHTSEVYSADNPAPYQVRLELSELPKEQVSVTMMPCTGIAPQQGNIHRGREHYWRQVSAG